MVRYYWWLVLGGVSLVLSGCSADAPPVATPPAASAATAADSPAATQASSAVTPAIKSGKAPLKELHLPYDFTLRLGRPEVYDLDTPLTLYNHLQVLHAGQLVYEDSTNEYEAARHPYPTTFADGTGGAVLLEVNNRDLNLLLRLRVQNGRAAVTDTLPTFQAGPGQFDHDATLEVAGFVGTNQVWGEQGQYTSYNPILYYELTPAGPVLDQELTKRKARQIYGRFLGFGPREQPAFPARRVGKATDAELTRIHAGGLLAR